MVVDSVVGLGQMKARVDVQKNNLTRTIYINLQQNKGEEVKKQILIFTSVIGLLIIFTIISHKLFLSQHHEDGMWLIDFMNAVYMVGSLVGIWFLVKVGIAYHDDL